MDDTLQTESDRMLALELGKLLDDHHGIDVIVMDMRPINFWTDFFIISTVTSDTHLYGLQRHTKDYLRERGMEILHRSRRPETGGREQQSDEWCLLDLGNIVIHLMTVRARQFFELERLWSVAPIIFRTDGSLTGGLKTDHSSKSS